MGLGKTLSMISLIAMNQACPGLGASIDFGYMKSPMKTTLLVVPPACKLDNRGRYSSINANTVIQAWQKQFSMSVLSRSAERSRFMDYEC